MEGGREGGDKRRLTRRGKRRAGVTMRSEEENRTLERIGRKGKEQGYEMTARLRLGKTDRETDRRVERKR